MKKYILDLSISQLKNNLKHFVKQDYRIEQILEWIYVKKATTFDECSNLPKGLRDTLDANFLLHSLTILKKEKSAIDGSVRYTFKASDNRRFFAVFLPSKKTNSICISSQVGCPVACSFCYSGKTRFIRNLTKGEIVEQILLVENDMKETITGVLFMGMGEPFLNLENVLPALTTIMSKKQLNIGKRHITLSTVGLVGGIKKVLEKNLGIRLAISLHAVDEKQRKKLIPNNLGFSISEIMLAAKSYLKNTNARITIEFILIKDINDSSATAHKLARLLRKFGFLTPSAQINLIPFNPIEKSTFLPPTQIVVDRFKNILKMNGFIVNVRKAKGTDIGAACGQLGL
ncbi:MAG: 23S rRNA (adenine(2503)-C(2))-methyltransferase RlmN [Elusimicrobiota bacterium]|jgi:23S rRNA (adenine2503-C2)-methyltransferase|nr:23S rRNA (adenine(2503)-C(2))-methyltransferase RlmN [Elusimicrobiota bacterium]